MPAPTDHETSRPGGGARSGTSRDGRATGVHTLPVGTRLRDYEITEVLSEASFAIVYLAYDHSLRRQVAIKEYMPVAMATRTAGTTFVGVRSDQNAGTYRVGLKSFLNEARLLARFDHPSLVKVYRFWEENGTAYMVMPYYQGPDLKTALAELGHVPTETELRNWLRPILDAVTVMHEAGFYHHHIGPDNIRLTELGPVLLDFAAARRVVEGETHTLAMSLKPGYAAIEQYGNGGPGTQGAWTDLYALAAVLYAAITGAVPMPAPERLARDGMLKLREAAATLYSDSFLHAIDAALSLQPEARPRDHAQFRGLMRDIDAPNEAIALSALRDLMLEPFVVDPARASGDGSAGSASESPAPRRSRPGAFNDAPITSPGAIGGRGPDSKPAALPDGGRPSRPGKLPDGGRDSRPGALASDARPSRPGQLDGTAPRSRPGALNEAKASKPGALAGSMNTRPGALDTAPSPLAASSKEKPVAKALSPRAQRIASAHEHSGDPSELNPDVDFSEALEPTPFLDRFGTATKVGVAAVLLALVGLSVWLAKPDLGGHNDTPVIATTPAAVPNTAPTAPAPVTPTEPPAATRPTPPVATTAPASAADSGSPLTAASRQARCVEILQKVSLEPMTPADAAFYKKECQR